MGSDHMCTVVCTQIRIFWKITAVASESIDSSSKYCRPFNNLPDIELVDHLASRLTPHFVQKSVDVRHFARLHEIPFETLQYCSYSSWHGWRTFRVIVTDFQYRFPRHFQSASTSSTSGLLSSTSYHRHPVHYGPSPRRLVGRRDERWMAAHILSSIPSMKHRSHTACITLCTIYLHYK